jgi:hypothetical protein
MKGNVERKKSELRSLLSLNSEGKNLFSLLEVKFEIEFLEHKEKFLR